MPQSKRLAAQPVTELPPKRVEAFGVSAGWILKSRGLRLDASFYNPRVAQAIEAIRRSGMAVERLGDVTARIIIPPRFKRIYVQKEYGVPFLQGRHIPQFQPTDLKYLSKLAQKRIEQWIIEEGWVLVTCSGTIGRVTIAPREWHGWAASQHILRIVPNLGESCPGGYLYAFLCSPEGQAQLTSTIYGAVVHEITEDHARSVLIPIPKTAAQRERVAMINRAALEAVAKKRAAMRSADESVAAFGAMLRALETDEDAADAEVARRRLADIAADPDAVVAGKELSKRLDELER